MTSSEPDAQSTTPGTRTSEGNAPDDGRVADAIDRNWVDTRAPVAWRPYLRLSRVDRPIGTWLLLLPCWWSVFAAAHAVGWQAQHAWILVGCALGAFLMRGAGCTWNDLTDRDFDGRVERTRSRPLPSGQVTPRQALIWAIVQSLLAFLILITFHPLAIALGVASLGLVAIYPFAKRFTWWPQIFLGLAFNWGALLAWAAATGSLGWAPLMIYLAGIAWTLFYDTIYAHQDKEDDALIGIKSTARLFGAATKVWLRGFMMATVLLMTIGLILAVATGGNLLALTVSILGAGAMGWHMVWQMSRLDIDDPEGCLSIFRSNRDTGLIPVGVLAFALLV
ncbi:MAG: 4-hydroxybenzoate octaprenyltransferase [Pseudomonadota bacterium]